MISILRIVGWYFLIFIQIKKELSITNSGEPDQTPHYVASDLVLHGVPMSHKKEASLFGLMQVKSIAECSPWSILQYL